MASIYGDCLYILKYLLMLVKFAYIINYREACQQVLDLIILCPKAVTKLIIIGIILNMNMEIIKSSYANMRLS